MLTSSPCSTPLSLVVLAAAESVLVTLDVDVLEFDEVSSILSKFAPTTA